MRLADRTATAGAAAILIAAAAVVYAPIVSALVRQWASDDNYSHGFIVVPFALFFAWRERYRLAAAEPKPSAAGIALAGAGLLLLTAGTLGMELFLTRISLIVFAAGSIAWVWGTRHLRLLAFPLGFLLLMIPLPAVVFNQIAFPLQLLASRAGAGMLSLAGVPVLREGNLIVLPSQTLEVAQACSGIRSLVSLLTIALVLGRLHEGPRGTAAALAILTVPVAIAANALRIAGTGAASQWIGPAAAEGFFHEFSGGVVFLLCVGLLLAVQRTLERVHRPRLLPSVIAVQP
jgi:exosortase